MGYLTCAVHKCLTDDQVADDLSQGLWPEGFTLRMRDDADRWAREVFAEATGRTVGPGSAAVQHAISQESSWVHIDQHFAPTSRAFMHFEGVRSLRNWRSALNFVARVERTRGGRALRGTAKQGIIDAFNMLLVSNRQPNLFHRMIAHLADPMRLRLILTTNFDDLIERSFAALGRGITALEVPLRGELPLLGSTASHRTLVKLHGGKLSTRADDSLDHPPTEGDLEAFRNYLGDRQGGPVPPDTVPKTLILVAGYSGSDRRCISLIKDVILRIKSVELLWIGSHADDWNSVLATFPEADLRGLWGERLHYCHSERPDLLLYELYQRLTKTIPSGGAPYQFSHRTPPRKEVPNPTTDELTAAEDIGTYLLEGSLQPHDVSISDRRKEPERRSGVAIHTKDGTYYRLIVGGSGAIRILSLLLSDSRLHYRKIWLELQNYRTPRSVYMDIMRALLIRSGEFHRGMTVLGADEPGQLNEDTIKRELHLLRARIRPQYDSWLVIIYARDGAGTNAGWGNESWSHAHEREFALIMKSLAEAGLRVILVPCPLDRVERGRTKARYVDSIANKCERRAKAPKRSAYWDAIRGTETPDLYGSGGASLSSEGGRLPADLSKRGLSWMMTKDETASVRNSDRESGNRKYESVVDAALNWTERARSASNTSSSIPAAGDSTDTQETRTRFLFALSLFRKSRHISAFYSEAVFPCPHAFNLDGEDNDNIRADVVNGWIDELGSDAADQPPLDSGRDRLGLFYLKEGGVFWMHRDVRVGLQKLLESRAISKEQDRVIGETRSRTHFFIGSWYYRSLIATRNSVPFVESIYHRIQAFLYSPTDRPHTSETSVDSDEIVRYRLHLARISLIGAIKTCAVGGSYMKFWITSPHSGVFDLRSEFFSTRLMFAFESLREQAGSKFANESKQVKKLIGQLKRAIHAIRDDITWETGQHTDDQVPYESQERASRSIATLRGAANSNRHEGWSDVFDGQVRELQLDWLKSVIDGTLSVQDHKNEYQRLKTEWLLAQSGAKGNRSIARAVALVTEITYFIARRAKWNEWTLEHKREIRRSSEESYRETISGIYASYPDWLLVTWLAYVGLDMCRCLDESYINFEFNQSEKLLSLYGLALARLGRFNESRRRIEEAYSYLVCNPSRDNTHSYILDLRQAEALLVEFVLRTRGAASPAQSNLDSESFEPEASSLGVLERAWLALNDAETSLRGASHSSRWWSLLWRLRLKALLLAQHVDDRAAYAAPLLGIKQKERLAWRALTAGLMATGNDHYRCLLIVRTFLEFISWTPASGSGTESSFPRARGYRSRVDEIDAIVLVCQRARTSSNDKLREYADRLLDEARRLRE